MIAQQPLAAGVDVGGIIAIDRLAVGAQKFIADNLRKSQHRIEGRLELMAHRRQKSRLGPVGEFGLAQGGAQGALGFEFLE